MKTMMQTTGRLKTKVRRRVVALCAGVMLTGAAAPVWGNVTQGQMIEALSKRGMHDLLDRLMELDPPGDAADRQLFAVAQARLRSDD
ncbi:MAG: hypothetical protein AAF328_07970, partial [Planctomycetota bacterium]